MLNTQAQYDWRFVKNVKDAEGLRLKAYKDTQGLWTIGYGHLLPDQDKDWSGYVIDQKMADDLLMADLAIARALTLTLPEATGLSGAAFYALMELVFNMGIGRWEGFHKCRAALQKRDQSAIQAELLDSKWAAQVGAVRAKRIAHQLSTGDWA